ncbi:MAG: ATP-binding protein [Prevotella sp.]|nr:ATP-binding protein [Candidatus Prevotella equi]
MHKTLKLTNDVSEVPQLGEWIEIIGEELMLPMPAVFQLNLALEEAVVNVMNYAYGEEKGQPVILDMEAEGDTLTFILSDNGAPFDPTAAEDPDITLSAEERGIGGLGIFLVKQLMEEVHYERENEQNKLTMIYKQTKE